MGEYGLNFFVEILLMMFGVLAGGLVERKLKFWYKVFAPIRMKSSIFAWMLAVLVIGSVGGILKFLVERGIAQIGASEIMVEVIGYIVLGFIIGMAVFYGDGEPKNDTK
ncbi:MAG: hypothetical protein FWF81_00420 [Defluviitaleaceae bacterium]|nr:hypothetical protein [Defluviitaleaceae bacterium]